MSTVLGLGLAALSGMALLAVVPPTLSDPSEPQEPLTVISPPGALTAPRDETLSPLTPVQLTPDAVLEPTPRPRQVKLPDAVETSDPRLWECYQIDMKVLGLWRLAYHFQKEAARFRAEAESSRGFAEHIFLQNVAREYDRLTAQARRELATWQERQHKASLP